MRTPQAGTLLPYFDQLFPMLRKCVAQSTHSAPIKSLVLLYAQYLAKPLADVDTRYVAFTELGGPLSLGQTHQSCPTSSPASVGDTRCCLQKAMATRDKHCLEVAALWLMPVIGCSLRTEKSCKSGSITDARLGLFRRVILIWSK